MPIEPFSDTDPRDTADPNAEPSSPAEVGSQQFQIEVPDPCGPPVPVKRHPFQFTLRSLMVGTLACGGVFAVLSRGTMSSCHGATRSSRLEWENRQLEIEQAAATSDDVVNDQSAQSAPAPDADPRGAGGVRESSE
jgi:hypothetical protein